MANTHKIFVTIMGTIEVPASDAETACDYVENMDIRDLAGRLASVEVTSEYETGPEPEYEHEDKLERDLDCD